MDKLKQILLSIADQPYHRIRCLNSNTYHFPFFQFSFLHIQGSPGAHPASIAEVTVRIQDSRIPDNCFEYKESRLALAEFLIRRFKAAIPVFAQQNRGMDGSGSFHTQTMSQKMLERDCVLFSQDSIKLRFIFSLPAKSRMLFDAEQTCLMFEQEMVPLIHFVFYYPDFDVDSRDQLAEFIQVPVIRQAIKKYMDLQGLCVFINNGAILPRQSGIDDQPLSENDVIPFQSPASLEVEIPLSGASSIKGMGIKAGITCITGGGFHGKSTLLAAMQTGVFAHIPGDGREFIVTRSDAVKITSEPGRFINSVDISAFINNLPNAQNTRTFSTNNASGSTSQAAAMIESIEVGTRFFLFDEDQCATNFLYRDNVIKKILDQRQEPIVPLYEQIEGLWQNFGISMILVIGGLGAFLGKADTCLLMDQYQCQDITAKVSGLSMDKTESNALQMNLRLKPRQLNRFNFDPVYKNQRLKKSVNKRIKDLRESPHQLEYGMDLINLESHAAVLDKAQTYCLGHCLYAIHVYLQQQVDGSVSLFQCLEDLFQQIAEQGWDVLASDYPGMFALPRIYEVAAAINRTRSLDIAN